MSDFIASVQAMAELVGPYLYLQALIIALVFIFLGKVADWIFSAMITRIAKRSSTRLDDEIVHERQVVQQGCIDGFSES